jgi:hypothetical protein
MTTRMTIQMAMLQFAKSVGQLMPLGFGPLVLAAVVN